MAARKLTLGRAAAFACLVFGAATALAAAAPKPTVEIKVSIRAESLARLPQRELVERGVASMVAERFRERFQFFDWAATGAGAKVATLTARVTQGAAQPLPTIDIDWVLEVAGEGEYRLPVNPQAIYSSGDMVRGLGEPTVFRADLERALREMLKEGFYDRFRDEVVQRIPVARTAKAIAADRMIAVPLRWSAAQLSPDAVLRVSFERQEGNATKRGYLDLDVLNERPSDPEKGMIQGGVVSAIWADGPMTLASRWHPQLPTLLDGASIMCRILKYREGTGSGSLGAIQLTP